MKTLLFKQSVAGYGDPARTGATRFGFTIGQISPIEDHLANAWITSGLAVLAPVETTIQPDYAVLSTKETAVSSKGTGRVKATVVEVPVDVKPSSESSDQS